jgi:hypothetical protein
MTPKIVFISGCAGSGGQYISRILQTITRNWQPVDDEYFDCYNDNSRENIINTIPSLPFANIEKEIHKFCGLGEFTGVNDLSSGREFFQENFKYEDLGFPFHIVLAHVLNPMPFLGVKDSKIIRININKSDVPQISYNFIKQFVQTELEHLKGLGLVTMKKELGRVQNKGKLVDLDPSKIDLNDDKLLTYIYWLCSKSSFESFSDIILPGSDTVFNVNFSDLMDGSIKDQIPSLAKFLHWDLTNDTIQSCNLLIDIYTKKQKKIPWTLDINDY